MIRRVSLALVAATLCGCATGRARRSAGGIEDCAAGASNALLSVDALECWFTAPHGRWRTLSHESHFDVLVVQVEASDLRDARDIASRFVASEQTTFSEILVYVRSAGQGRTRRVAWTKAGGTDVLDVLDFRAQ